MAENIEQLGEELDGDGEKAPKNGIDPAVLAAAEKAGAAKLYAQIVSDPQVGKLLQARAAGKKADVMVEGEQQNNKQSEQVEKELDFTTATEQEKMQYMIRQVAKTTDGIIESKLKPVQDRLTSLDEFADTLRKKDAVDQVGMVKKEFKDFDQHAQRMAELAGENPNLSARQLYILAAQEAGVLTRSEHRTSSERPGNNTARPAKKKEVNLKPSFGGLREAISQAAASVAERLGVDDD